MAERIKGKRLILFLCTGDICRSPMAVFYMRKKLEEKKIKNIECRGSGVMTVSSLLPAPETVIVMREDEIDIGTHRSTKLTKELIKKADLVLGMTPFHVQMAKRVSELAKGKTFLFKEYVEDTPKMYQIADPMGGTLETFKTTYRHIKDAINKLIDMEMKGIYKKKTVTVQPTPVAPSLEIKVRKRGRPRKEEQLKKQEQLKEEMDKQKIKEKASPKSKTGETDIAPSKRGRKKKGTTGKK